MKKFNIAILCILLSFVLLLVACGGGEGTSDDQQQPDSTQGSEVTDVENEETRNPADAEFDSSIFASDNEVMYT